MDGIVRTIVPIKSAEVILHYEDGSKEVARLDGREAVKMLTEAGYVVPRHYHETRNAKALTLDELYEAMRLREIGCSWSDIEDAFLVPKDDLRKRMREKDKKRYRSANKENRHVRDKELYDMVQGGLTQAQVSARMGVTYTMVRRACKRIELGYYESVVE